MLGDQPHAANSPIDPNGKWYSAPLAERAETYYRRRFDKRRAKSKILPADEAQSRGDPELAARFAAQDRERARLRAGIVGDGRLANGQPSPEALAFVALCTRQTMANMAFATARWQRKSKVRKWNISDEIAAARADSV